MALQDGFQLGDWQVLPALNRIRKQGRERRLEPKSMKVLVFLAARAPQVARREELFDAVWPGEFVSEHVLSRCISDLRKALQDDPQAPRLIETIRKSGYRLLVRPMLPEDTLPARSNRWARGLWPAVAILLSGLLALALGLAWTRQAAPAIRQAAIQARPLTSLQGSELDPALSPQGRYLAFSWDGEEGGNYDIYVKPMESETPLRLTRHPGEDKNPAWSPDGRQIAFVRSSAGENGLYSVSLMGGGERLLSRCNTGDIPDLAWSSDGQHLYFADRPRQGAPTAIFELHLGTGKRRAVTSPPEYFFGDRDLALSHDGTRIAYARAKVPTVEDLYLTRLGDGATRRLTYDQASIMGIEWTEDDSEVLFSSTRGNQDLLWRIPAQGGSPRPLPSYGQEAYDPSLAAGQQLVFESKQYETNIWRLDLQADDDEGQLQKAVGSTRWDLSPVLSPDGRRLAFVSTRTGSPQIWISDADGSNPLRLTGQDLLPSQLTWTPAGDRIVFVDRRSDQTDLMSCPTQAGSVERLIGHPANEISPAFSGDGQRLYFASDRSGEWEIWSVDAQRPQGSARRVTAAGAVRALESWQGAFLYFTCHNQPGLWRQPLSGGTPERISPLPAVGNWMEWALGPEHAYLLDRQGPAASLTAIYLKDGSRSERLDRLHPHLAYYGDGMSLSPDGRWLYFSRMDRAESDIVLVDSFR